MTTAKKKPTKKPAAKAARPSRTVTPLRPRYSEQYERAVNELERGLRALHGKDFTEALASFTRLVEQCSDEAEICERARQYISICNQRLREKPHEPATPSEQFHLGVFHLNRAETELALQHFEKALATRPMDDMVHYAMAAAYAKAGEKSRAVSALQEAVRLNDRNRVFAQNDSDFDRIRDEHDFIQIVEPEAPRGQ